MAYVVLNFEVASCSNFRDIQTNHIVTMAAVDIDDRIKRKRIRLSLKNTPERLVAMTTESTCNSHF